MPLGPEPKDYMRVDDIMLKKAPADKFKQRQLATNMANAITKSDKAWRRYKAAEERGYSDIAQIFLDKYNQLSGQRVKMTPTSAPAAKAKPSTTKKTHPTASPNINADHAKKFQIAKDTIENSKVPATQIDLRLLKAIEKNLTTNGQLSAADMQQLNSLYKEYK